MAVVWKRKGRAGRGAPSPVHADRAGALERLRRIAERRGMVLEELPDGEVRYVAPGARYGYRGFPELLVGVVHDPG